MSLIEQSAAYLWNTSYAGETRISPQSGEQVTRALMRGFPGWLIWRGRFTGSWWALSPSGHPYRGLVEAATPDELTTESSESTSGS